MAVNTNVIDAHHGMNPQIKWLDTTKAKAIWDLYFQQINPDQKQITQLTGYYEDKYEKINGEWKITETRFSVSSSVMTQYDTEQLKALHVGAAPSV